MVGPKSTRTRVVGIITDEIHPYILFSSNGVSMKNVYGCHPYLPYSGKFSRGPIFMVFMDDCLTTKIKRAKKKPDCIVLNGYECTCPRNLNPRNVKMGSPRKLNPVKFSLYVV